MILLGRDIWELVPSASWTLPWHLLPPLILIGIPLWSFIVTMSIRAFLGLVSVDRITRPHRKAPGKKEEENSDEKQNYVHRIGRTGRAKRKGAAYSIIGNFPEKAKLDEIAKYSNYQIRPMLLGQDGTLTDEPVKEAVPVKKRFR